MKGYNKTVFVILGVLLIFSISIGLTIFKSEKQEDKEFKYLDQNTYNTLVYSRITEKEIASLYLTDLNKYLLSNIEEAYSLLTEDCKNNKFNNITIFQNYIDSMNLLLKFNDYKTEVVDNNYIFTINTTSNIKITFYTTGVMEYTFSIE